MNHVAIYALRDPFSGDIRYVGKTRRSHRLRLSEHLREAQNRNRHTPRDRWLRKLLPSVPEIVVLEYCPLNDWIESECRWIVVMRLHYPNLTNLTEGGETSPFENGRRHTEESKTKMRVAALADGRRPLSLRGRIPWNKGKTCLQGTREKLRTSHLGQVAWNKGKPWSDETKAKLSAAHVGQPSAMKGRKHSPETRAKLRTARARQVMVKGQKRTPEQRARMREATLAHHRNKSEKELINGGRTMVIY